MSIASWNCNGKFREKYRNIQKIKADIYVIQECENPKKYMESDYNNFAKKLFWIGENENKGLVSAYHYFYKEKQGYETKNTFY